MIGELEGRRFALDLSSPQARGNYAVISSIDPRLQAIAEKQLKAFLEGPGGRAGLSQGALISIDTSTGAILAYVGGGDYSRSSFDRVQALRQPGSTFKLFAYLAALEAGVQPADAVSCAPLAYVAGCRQGGGDCRQHQRGSGLRQLGERGGPAAGPEGRPGQGGGQGSPAGHQHADGGELLDGAGGQGDLPL